MLQKGLNGENKNKFFFGKLTSSLVPGPNISPENGFVLSVMVLSPIFSDIPQSLTICVAIDVACFKSELAPKNKKISSKHWQTNLLFPAVDSTPPWSCYENF